MPINDLGPRHGARRHARATVNPREQRDLLAADVMAASLHNNDHGRVIGEDLECRRILDIAAAGFAAERASTEDVGRLAEAVVRIEDVANRPPRRANLRLLQDAETAFHTTLVAAARNRALAGLSQRLQTAFTLAHPPIAGSRRARIATQYARILDAITSGDANAAREAMAEHLATFAVDSSQSRPANHTRVSD